jgi:hypothetical protein
MSAVSRLVVAAELVAELTDAVEGIDEALDVYVTTDPDEAAGALPAVLIVPPAVDFTAHEPVVTWSLKLLTSSTSAGVAAWEELDGMLAEVERILPVESATPGAYALSPEVPPVPCYSVTLITQGHI